MKLSIVTINYNNLGGLQQTYASIVSQTFTDFEWIVIDGGSTDGSREFIEQHQSHFAYWCSEPDGGIYRALNKGVGFAHGEYISFMNAGDCYFEANTLQKVFSAPHKGDILYGDTLFVKENSEEVKRYTDTITFNWLRHFTINHQSSFTRRVIFDQLQFDPKYRILADRKFWMQSMLAGFSFEHIPHVVARYDYCGYSTTNIEKWEAERQAICNELLPQCLNESLDHAFIYEMHQDLQKAYSLLEHHGPCRKLLHWCIDILCRFRSK